MTNPVLVQASMVVKSCAELVRRDRDPSGQGWTYTCPHGHCRKDANFHPIRKGKIANSLLMVSLAAALMFHFA